MIQLKKKCSKCKEPKLLTEFYKRGGKQKGVRRRCISCMAQETKAYHSTDKGKAVLKKASQKYYRTEKGLKAHRRGSKKFFATEKGNVVNKRARWKYNRSENGKLVRRRGQAKRDRDLGFNPLNDSFEGSAWHHINDNDVVAIPDAIHRNHYCKDRQKHRDLVLAYYGSLENMLQVNTKVRKVS